MAFFKKTIFSQLNLLFNFIKFRKLLEISKNNAKQDCPQKKKKKKKKRKKISCRIEQRDIHIVNLFRFVSNLCYGCCVNLANLM